MSSSSGPGEAPGGPGLAVISCLLVPRLRRSLEQPAPFLGWGSGAHRCGSRGEEALPVKSRPLPQPGAPLLGRGCRVRSLLVPSGNRGLWP